MAEELPDNVIDVSTPLKLDLKRNSIRKNKEAKIVGSDAWWTKYDNQRLADQGITPESMAADLKAKKAAEENHVAEVISLAQWKQNKNIKNT
jgi:hypothetical protein